MLFVHSRKAKDESSSLSRDDIQTPNISESSCFAEPSSTDDEIHHSGSNEMCFANIEEIGHNQRLFDERRYEKEYTWLYYNFNKKSYLCKICEVFYGESKTYLVEVGGHGCITLLSLRIILVKKLTQHEKSVKHKDAINSLTNLKIKDALEKIDTPTKREKSRSNCMWKS